MCTANFFSFSRLLSLQRLISRSSRKSLTWFDGQNCAAGYTCCLTPLLQIHEYDAHHAGEPAVADDEVDVWDGPPEPQGFDAEFVGRLDQRTLFELIVVRVTLQVSSPISRTDRDPMSQAANTLQHRRLLDLTCQHVARLLRGKTPAEIRATFNIENNFTPEEEEAVCVCGST